MLSTRFGNILSHKYDNEYICYDSTVHHVLKDRLLSEYALGNLRLNNTNNFLDYRNGWIKKHFWRKGSMAFLNDSYIYLGLSRTRPVHELKNYIDFNHIITNLNNNRLINILSLCRPILAHVRRKNIFYSGNIILTKMDGITLDQALIDNDQDLWDDLAFCFKILFRNGIFNLDMNLKNILVNNSLGKISFIDFDKLTIDTNNKNYIKNTKLVMNKFEKSLNKYNVMNQRNWSKLYSYILN